MTDVPFFKKVVDVVGLSIAFFGVPAFFYTQHLENHALRVERSLEYVSKLNTDPILEKRLSILSALATPASSVLLSSGPSNAQLASHVGSLAEGDPDLLDAILSLTQFFDEVAACKSAKLCDSETIEELMLQDALDTSKLLGPFVTSFSQQYLLPRFGCGLAWLAGAADDGRCD